MSAAWRFFTLAKKDKIKKPKERKPRKQGKGEPLPKLDAPGMLGQSTPERVAKRHRRRTIAAFVASISSAVLIALSIIAFLGRVSGNFTVTIDPRDYTNRLTLSQGIDGSRTPTLLGSGIENAKPIAASEVFRYLENEVYPLPQEQAQGSHNYEVGEGEERSAYAMTYTFYLHNQTDEELPYRHSFFIESYSSPTNDALEPYEYLRIALYVNEPASFPGDDETHEKEIYGLESNYPGTGEGENDTRECVSSFTGPVDEDGNPITRYPRTDSGEETSGYCTPFIDSTGHIIDETRTILPLQTLRYTVVAWLEGFDPECRGKAPEGASMTFRMEFDA